MIPIECSTLARTFDLVRFFRRLDLVYAAAVAVAAIDKVLRLGCVLADHCPLAAVGLVAHTRVSLPCNRSGSTVLSATLAGVATTAWISLLRLSTPKCPFIPN
jgi:hypothetical protein